MIAKDRTIVIGDVHGCFDELRELLLRCSFHPQKDRLIFVGDVVNKGPKSLETLRFIKEGGHLSILGNHELKLLQVAAAPVRQPSSIARLLEQMEKVLGEKLSEWLSWISHWPAYIEEDDFLVVHGGLVPGKKPADTPVEILANIRTWDGKGENLNRPGDPAWHELYQGEKLVVYGHWALQGLCVKSHSIGLDSGCVYGRELSAVILPERRIVQVKAREAYVSID